MKYPPFYLVLLLFSSVSQAAWHCPSVDSQGSFYTVASEYVKTSVYKSLDKCKKQSRYPASCQTERGFCQKTGSDANAQNHWRCNAYDRKDQPYRSGPYLNKYQAVFAAESICKRLSIKPQSCYVMPFTCEAL